MFTFFEVVNFSAWVSHIVLSDSFVLSFDISLPTTIVELILLSNRFHKLFTIYLPLHVLIHPFRIGEKELVLYFAHFVGFRKWDSTLHSRLVQSFLFSLSVIWASLRCVMSHSKSLSELCVCFTKFRRSMPWICSSYDGCALYWSLLVFFFWFPPFIFFDMGSSWDFMVLTSWVASSKLAVLICLLLPERAYLYWYRSCAESFLVHYLKNLHYYEECPGPCNKHVFFALVSSPLGWPTLFILRLPVRPFSGLDGEADAPPFFFLPELTQSDSSHWLFLEGAPPS